MICPICTSTNTKPLKSYNGWSCNNCLSNAQTTIHAKTHMPYTFYIIYHTNNISHQNLQNFQYFTCCPQNTLFIPVDGEIPL